MPLHERRDGETNGPQHQIRLQTNLARKACSVETGSTVAIMFTNVAATSESSDLGYFPCLSTCINNERILHGAAKNCAILLSLV